MGEMTMYEAQNAIDAFLRPFDKVRNIRDALAVTIQMIETQESLAAKAVEKRKIAEDLAAKSEEMVSATRATIETELSDARATIVRMNSEAETRMKKELSAHTVKNKRLADEFTAMEKALNTERIKLSTEIGSLKEELVRLQGVIEDAKKEESRLMKKFGVKA